MALPPPLATFQTWLDSTIVDEPRAEAVLSRVTSLVLSEAGTTWDADAEPDDIVTVILEVSKRVYQNPRNARQQTAEPYAITHQIIGLELTADERTRIARASRTYPRGGYGLWALGTTRDDPAADTAYVPVVGTDTQFPWYADDVVV